MVNPTQDPPNSSNPFQTHSSYPLFFSSTNSSENIHNAMDEFSNPNFSNTASHDAHSNPLFYSSSSNPSTLFNPQLPRSTSTSNPFNNPTTSSASTTSFQLSPYLNNQPSPPQNPTGNQISLDEFLSLSNPELYMTNSNPTQHAPTGSGSSFAPQQMANRNANQSTVNTTFPQQMSSSPQGFLHPLFQNASGAGNTGGMNPPSPPLHEDSSAATTSTGGTNTGFQNSMNNPTATSTMNPGSMFFPLFANPTNTSAGPGSYLSALLDSAAHTNPNQPNANAAAALMNVNPLLQNTGNFMFNMPQATNPNNPPSFYGMEQVSSPNLNMFGMPPMGYDMTASPLQKPNMKLQSVASSKKKSMKSETASPSTKQTSFINSPAMGIGSSSSSSGNTSNRTASYYDKDNVIITNNDAIKNVSTLPNKQYPHHIRMQQQGTDTDDGTKLIPTTILSSPQLQQGSSNSNSSHSLEPGEHSDQESHQGITVEQAHPLSFSLDPAPSDQINTFVKPARKSSKYFIPYFPQKLYCAPYKYDVRIHLPENIPQEELDNDYKISFKLLDGETKKPLKQNTKGEASISIEKCSKGKPGGGIAEEEILAHQEASHITMYRICFTVCSFHNFRRPFLLATKLKPLLKGSVSPQTNQIRKMIVHESDLFYIYARKNNREAETWGDSNLTTAMTKKATGHAATASNVNTAMANNVFDMSFPMQQGDTQEYMQFGNTSPLMDQGDAKKKGSGKKRKRSEEQQQQQQQLITSPVQSTVATPSNTSTSSTNNNNNTASLNFNNLPTFHIQSDQQGKKIRLSISDPAPLLQSPLLFQQIASNLNQQYRSPTQSNIMQQPATAALLDTSNLMMHQKEEEQQQQRVPSELQTAFELKDPLEETSRDERNPKSVGSTEHVAHATTQDANVSANAEDNARKTDATDTMEDYSARMRQNMINESGESSHFSTEIDHLLY